MYNSDNCISLQGKNLVENGFTYIENIIKSEAGRRLTSVVPRLVAAKDLEKMLEVKGRHFKTSISTKKDLVQMLKLNDEFLSPQHQMLF